MLEDVAARRSTVAHALEILQPVVRPLALEITFGAMDPETFAVGPVTSRRIASRELPAGVACQSALARPAELETVDTITPEILTRVLTPPSPGWDFSTIRVLVTAARSDAIELQIDRMPSRSIPILEADDGRWVVGPIDAPGDRLSPPIGLLWQQEWGDVQLTVQSFWSLWGQSGSSEHAVLRAAESALDAAGFVART